MLSLLMGLVHDLSSNAGIGSGGELLLCCHKHVFPWTPTVLLFSFDVGVGFCDHIFAMDEVKAWLIP